GVADVWHSEVAWQMLTQAELRQTWLPLQSASVVQAMGPESGGPPFPLLHAEKTTMAPSAKAVRISLCVTRVPLCNPSRAVPSAESAQGAGRGPRGQYASSLYLFPAMLFALLLLLTDAVLPQPQLEAAFLSAIAA